MSIESFKVHHPKLAYSFALAAGLGAYFAGSSTMAVILHAASLSPDQSAGHAAMAIVGALGAGSAIVAGGIALARKLDP